MNVKPTDHNEHSQLMTELPWLVNGTMDRSKAASLQAHVSSCEVCQAEVASLTLMQQTIVRAPIQQADCAASLERMRQRISAESSQPANRLVRLMAWVQRVMRDHQTHSLAVATVCGLLLAVVLMPLSDWSLNNEDDSYRVLSNGATVPGVVLAVTFKEELTKSQSEDILLSVTKKLSMQSDWKKVGPDTYRLSSLNNAEEQPLSPADLKQLMDAFHHDPGVKNTRVMP